ncbi:SusC/RagA family TonB-linked outer membrane protein [Winogradskyella sp.]|uniref:SusC/RagA family TonB-linked outer membrane protein n=1 Tax=Winogradskyella sp. TaxID=1883156 RepID=UPI003BADA992
MENLKNYFLFFLFLVSTMSFAQKIVVTGKISTKEGIPLPGAIILEKGTTNGVQTDFNGEFSIDVSEDAILEISFIGFKSQEIKASTQPMEIVLEEDVSRLEEVIVTGYSTQKKSRVTGAAENLEVDAVKTAARGALQENLQGNVSGVQVVASSGQPGATPNVRIRGVGSFEGSAPLYVIDGLQTRSASTIASLNPDDIESFTVLKDAAATSIYGVRGSNGVIVITTKSGLKGGVKVSYGVQSGFSYATAAQRFKPLSTEEFGELMTEGVINAGLADNQTDALTYLTDRGFNPDISTDWYDLNTRTALYQQHTLSIGGGAEKTQFLLSGGYFNQDGVILSSDFERMNGRLRVDHQFNDRIEATVFVTYNKTITNDRPSGGRFANPVRSIYRIRPDISPFNDDGTYNFTFNSTHNPLAQAEEVIQRDIRHTVLASANVRYKITNDLTFESLINMNQTFEDEFERRPAGFGDARPLGEGFQDSNFLFNWLFRNLLRYNKTWDDHNLTAFLGYEFQKTRNKLTELETQNIPDGFTDLANGTVPTVASTSKFISGLNSAFINAEYAYGNKYLLSASLRRDGSSEFSDDNKYGVFWSVGIGWNIAKEKFMDNQSVFDDLKFRASYGVNGNDGLGGVFNLFSVNNYNEAPGIIFSSLGNPDLVWEKNKPLNIGLDYALFNRRISGSIDWYNRETVDLLRGQPVSALNGDTTLSENIGSMENTGIELTLTTRNIVSPDGEGFSWTTSANFTANKNEVTKLSRDNEPIEGATSIIAVGEDINTFYLPLYAGVDPANGNALWYTDGTRTEVTSNYNNAEQAIVGKATPDFYAGFRSTMQYKNFTLDFLLYTSWGGLLYDTWARFTNSDGSRRLSTTGNINRGTYERRWQQPGDVTDVPRFVYGNTQSGLSSQSSSRFIYDGSYIRLRDVTLSYDLDSSLLDYLKLDRAQIFLKGNNLWTYIKDDRLERDPEAGLDGRLNQEIPIAKTFFIGLNVTF